MVTLLAGVVAGGLGALLGLGGGILLVPLLNVGLGLTFGEARAISLFSVLAVSSAMGASAMGRRLLNVRLAVLLLLFSVGGASFGAAVLDRLPASVYPKIFGLITPVIAVVMLLRLGSRNVLERGSVQLGMLGGHFYDEDSKSEVSYRVRRLPVAAVVAFAAGLLATFIGIGGGILIVPALNSWCGVPLRVAAATSAFMIGVTAIPGSVKHWNDGYLHNFDLAGAIAFGAVIGFELGHHVSANAPVRWLKVLMAAMLLVVSVRYIF